VNAFGGAQLLLLLVCAHAFTAAALATLLARFRYQFKRGYLQRWSLAFAALALGLLIERVPNLLHIPTARTLIWSLSLSLSYISVFLMLVGTWEATSGRVLPTERMRTILMGLVVFGVGSALMYSWDDAAVMEQLALRVGVRHLLAGIAFAAASALLLRAPSIRIGLGPKLLASALALGSLQQFHVLVIHVAPIPGISPLTYAALISIVDLLISVFIGFGMGIWLLEDERRAAALASREVAHLAYHDALTGMPNRRLLLDRLSQAIAQAKRSEEKVVVLFLDLDRFKVINDSLGHSLGDELLCSVASRLKHRTRAGDTIARIGGDEFALVVPRIVRPTDAVQIAEGLLRTIRAPFTLANRELFVTTSVGIAFFPDDGADAESLLRHADLAMYKAKEEGRNNFQLFVPQMKDLAVEQLELENELRRALAQKELALHYQPLIDMASGRIAGVEALVRWPHPTRGTIMPDRFLPVAEQLGLLEGIDEWVLTTATRQAKVWQNDNGYDIKVSVNLSPRTIQRPDLHFQVQQLLAEARLEPGTLCVEVTERTAMQNVEVGMDTLSRLRDIGVGVAIDDFGTGYSSLSYLRHLPANVLKIDKSFVREMLRDKADRAIIAAVVPLAHTLGMEVVAEGVETPEQRDLLLSMGVDQAQGWLYHRALAPELLDEMLAADADRTRPPRLGNVKTG
jgi:diguanylate cyclase (GGDEF)-like protein